MSPHLRILLGVLALASTAYTVWALKTGIIHGRDLKRWDRRRNPGVFALHVACALVFIAWTSLAAAGVSIEDAAASLGIGAMFSQG